MVEENATSQESSMLTKQWLHSNDLLLLPSMTASMSVDDVASDT